jgi:hypothetical protein
MIDESNLSADEKYKHKITIENRNKAINTGKQDPYKEYDPGKRAEISRLIRTNPEEITKRGGAEYIYKHVGLGTKGGITIEQAEKFVKDYKGSNTPSTGPLNQETYKQAVGSLDLFRKNLHFIDADPGDKIDDAESAENEYTYGLLVEELETRVLDGEKPYEVLEDIMKPYALKDSSFWGSLFSWVGSIPPITPETAPAGAIGKLISGGDKRSRAIDILKKNNKVVSEETIKTIMDQL